jgi:hypothetical protein
MSGSRLAALVDGRDLPEDEARALGVEFSAHMDEHRGDMAGFAQKKGFHAVRPEHRTGRAVLVVWTTAQAAIEAAERENEERIKAARRAGAKAKKPASAKAKGNDKPGKKQGSPAKGRAGAGKPQKKR